MRSITNGLKLAVKEGTIATLIKIICKNGTIYAYTDHDMQLIVDSITYIPAPGLSKLRQHTTVQNQISNQTLQSAWVDAPSSDLISGVFDEAEIRVSWTNWKDVSQGQIVTFVGRLGQISWTDIGFSADIVGFLKDLERNLNVTYIPTCRHKLFGSTGVGKAGACGLSPTAFTTTGTVLTIVASKWSFTISTVAADGMYSNASISFTTGSNTGLTFEIRNHSSNKLDLFLPTAFIIQVGDSYSITKGCDKTFATCKNKFNNVVNFGGFPSVQPQVNFR